MTAWKGTTLDVDEDQSLEIDEEVPAEGILRWLDAPTEQAAGLDREDFEAVFGDEFKSKGGRGQPRDRHGRWTGPGSESGAPGEPGPNPVVQGRARRIRASEKAKHVSPAEAESMQQEMFDNHQKWTVEQATALSGYTEHTTGTRINGALRGWHDPTDKDIHDAATIRAAMKPTTRSVVVTRTVKTDMFGAKGETLTPAECKALQGRSFHDRGFTSTTVVHRPPSGYPTGVTMHISVPKGTRASYIESLSAAPGEHEMLLDRGTHFHIDRVIPGSPAIMHATVVGQNA